MMLLHHQTDDTHAIHRGISWDISDRPLVLRARAKWIQHLMAQCTAVLLTHVYRGVQVWGLDWEDVDIIVFARTLLNIQILVSP